MTERKKQTQATSASKCIEPFINSESQKEQLKVAAAQLRGPGFPLIVESVKFQIKTEWEKSRSPDVRERLHAELAALGRIQKRIRGLVQAIERG